MEFRYDDDKKKLIVSKSSKLEYNQCKLWLNRQVKGWKFMPAAKYGWKGYVDYFHDGQINLGLWKECFKACQEIGTSFNIENKQDFPLNRDVTLKDVTEFCNEFFKDHKVKNKEGEWVPFMPYDYQIETAYKILKNRYCLGQVATSGGKSLIVSIVFFYILENIDPDAKFLLVVPSITLVTQFYDNIVDYNLGENEGNKNPVDLRIEEIMSDKPRKHSGTKDPNLYIACFQSLAKKDKKTGESNWSDEFFQQFHTVAVDECLEGNSLISMADNTLKPIKDIREGEYVKTVNEKTGNIENKKVESVYENMINSLSEDMYEIEMENGDVLNITGNHKVKLINGEWVRVDQLNEEDEILYINEMTAMKGK